MLEPAILELPLHFDLSSTSPSLHQLHRQHQPVAYPGARLGLDQIAQPSRHAGFKLHDIARAGRARELSAAQRRQLQACQRRDCRSKRSALASITGGASAGNNA